MLVVLSALQVSNKTNHQVRMAASTPAVSHATGVLCCSRGIRRSNRLHAPLSPHADCVLPAGPIGMGVAMAIGLFDVQESVAMVPTHVWDAVPSDVVTSVILAAAAATMAGVSINEYKDSTIGSNADPMIVHAGALLLHAVRLGSQLQGAVCAVWHLGPCMSSCLPSFQSSAQLNTRMAAFRAAALPTCRHQHHLPHQLC